MAKLAKLASLSLALIASDAAAAPMNMRYARWRCASRNRSLVAACEFKFAVLLLRSTAR